MKVHLFSNGSHAASAFAALKRSRRYDLEISEPSDPRRAIRSCDPGEFVYVDVSHLEGEELVVFARKLTRVASCPFGLVHASDGPADPSRLFFAGASDYIGASALELGITTKRMDEVMRFIEHREVEHREALEAGSSAAAAVDTPGDAAAAPDSSRYILSGTDWDGIEPSHEYTFWLLLAELDDISRYANQTSGTYTEELVAAFRKRVTDAVEHYNGRVWIWKKTGGLLLFPFDGSTCNPIVPMMRLVLNRAIADVEHYGLKSDSSFRLALHLGNTVFESEGRTGGIVSETVNFIFHLGQRYLEPGDVGVTAEAFSFLPSSLKPYFERSASFEGHRIARLRRFSRAAPPKS
ncbi:MAG: hypothetical protein GVY23_05425 [Spirochaetes bacterium]|jgi:class 3 adenylate cyclase|nr:hypothetical protein [Spirochaetota bacterium]